MAPIRLTLKQRLAVACYHSFGSQHPNWVVDSAHGHSVCYHCGKPSPEAVIRICSEPDCGNEFVIEFNWKWLPKVGTLAGTNRLIEFTFLCPSCNGDD